MREILFRGFCSNKEGKTTITLNGEKIKGEWVKGYLVRSATWQHYIINNFSSNSFTRYLVISETVSEYTGLTDKNGKKIFEGDIVEYSDEECYYPEECTKFVGEICFEKGAFGLGTKDNPPLDLENWCNNDNFVSLWELYWNLNCCVDELPMLEIIGNIHDNPELLK